MRDPYEVLGVSTNATDEEIKSAYHELVKKYHPDKYQDNPLKELAQEKLQEVNEAYDTLMKKGNNFFGGSGGTSGTSSYGSTGTYGGFSGNQYGPFSSAGAQYNQEYAQIRAALNRGELSKADQMLINHGARDAEWYYLSGILSYRRGYVDDALINIRQAMSMAPNNSEYRQMYQRMTGSGTLYKTSSNSAGYGSDACAQCITCYCCSSMVSPCW